MNEITDVRSYNCGASDYSKHKFQSWSFWILFRLNPWDGDITKRVLRKKSTDPRILDYKKIKHIALERIRQFQNNENVFPIENLEPKDITLGEMLEDYDLTSDDVVILTRILYPNTSNRVSDYEEIISICDKRIAELEKEENK